MKTGLTQEEVRKIAKLARLKLAPEETALYQSQLLKILESMSELGKLDTKNVEPMTSSLLNAENVWRDDHPETFPEVPKIMDNAPSREGPYFKTPKVIED